MNDSLPPSRRQKGLASVPSDDVIFKILTYLPVKTLLKFKRVSKSWYDAISDPNFHGFYSQRPIHSRLRLLVLSFYHPPYSVGPPDWSPKRIGLGFNPHLPRPFCLDFACYHDCSRICLWNPSTRVHTEISTTENLVRSVVVGMAYISSAKQYKFLRISYDDADLCCPTLFIVSATDGGVSKKMVSLPPFAVETFLPEPTVVNGAVYMLPNDYDDVFSGSIARFDLEKEEWSVLPGPPGTYQTKTSELSLRDLSGFLCMTRSNKKILQLMWILKDRVWTELRLDESLFENLKISDFILTLPVEPLAVMEDGRLLMKVDTEPFPRLIYYDPKGNKEVEVVYQFTTWQQLRTLVYTEGFACPGMITGNTGYEVYKSVWKKS